MNFDPVKHGELIAAQGERLLLVCGDEQRSLELNKLLSKAGYEVSQTHDGVDGIDKSQTNPFDIVLRCLTSNRKDDLNDVSRVKKQSNASTIIIMAPQSTVEFTLQAMKLGADDVVDSSCQADDLLLTLKKAKERDRLSIENELLRNQVAKRYSFNNIVSNSPGMIEIFETIKKVADYRTTILLYGESGTGKELIARAIHHNSVRRNKRFVAINCGAIPENLLESELFGHKRGAFTDATRDKKGLFEEAEGGTILLDEVGELPLHLQVKLLRVLQENEIRPVGDGRSIPIDVRVVAATLRDLEEDVLNNRFRDDLYYRLNVISLKVPPLRERKEDIPLLVNHFLRKNHEKLGLPVYGICKKALAILIEHEWPGNIRELENSIERAMILTDGEEISVKSLPKAVKGSGELIRQVTLPADELSIKVHSRILEESLIRKALETTGGNRTHAAKLLEISHRTLLYKLKEYNLNNAAANNSKAKE